MATEMTLKKPFKTSQVDDRGELNRRKKVGKSFQTEETK